jgi:hypothetical protein
VTLMPRWSESSRCLRCSQHTGTGAAACSALLSTHLPGGREPCHALERSASSGGLTAPRLPLVLQSEKNFYYVLKVKKDTSTGEAKINYYKLRWAGAVPGCPPPGQHPQPRSQPPHSAQQRLPPCCLSPRSRLVHPDKCKHPRAADAAAVLNQAWDTLSNPIKKRAYDAYGGNKGTGGVDCLCTSSSALAAATMDGLSPPPLSLSPPLHCRGPSVPVPRPLGCAVEDINVDAPEGMSYAEWEASNVSMSPCCWDPPPPPPAAAGHRGACNRRRSSAGLPAVPARRGPLLAPPSPHPARRMLPPAAVPPLWMLLPSLLDLLLCV